MFLPVVQQSLHQAGDGGDQRDAALPPRLPLNLFQQTGGRNEEDTETDADVRTKNQHNVQ